jgi:hypothetical protein
MKTNGENIVDYTLFEPKCATCKEKNLPFPKYVVVETTTYWRQEKKYFVGISQSKLFTSHGDIIKTFPDENLRKILDAHYNEVASIKQNHNKGIINRSDAYNKLKTYTK